MGLDDTAMAVYGALLTTGGSPADISAVTGLPESGVRAALRALAELNLVRAPLGMSDDWRPVRPELGFTALLQQQEADLARRAHQVAALRAAATAASATWSTRLQHVAGVFEPLDNCEDALAEAGRLAAQATTEYMQVMPAGPEALAALHPDLSRHEAAVARGVSVKALYHDSVRADPAALGHARRAALTGAEVRTAPIPPLPLVICDRQVALIPAGHERHEAALCVSEPAIVAVLSAVFDNSWDTATPLGSIITPDETTRLTPSDRALLQLLAGGLTDEAAAKRLGVSLRTVRRQMRALMTRLQATSRFQAGHNAAQRGWLLTTMGSQETQNRRPPETDHDEPHGLEPAMALDIRGSATQADAS
jgi:DNA-binding NarL/FixJ family response regulator